MNAKAFALRDLDSTKIAAAPIPAHLTPQAPGPAVDRFTRLMDDISAADADEAAAALRLPLWGVTVTTDGITTKYTERALLPGDVAECAAQKLQDFEMGDDGAPYSEVVITIRRVPA